jgi:hypothetical protein
MSTVFRLRQVIGKGLSMLTQIMSEHALACVLVVAGMSGAPPISDDPTEAAIAAQSQPQTVPDYLPRRSMPMLNQFLSWDVPLQRDELDTWAAILNLSDAQRRFVEIEYLRFIDAVNERSDRLIPEFLESSRQLWQSYDSGHRDSREFVRAVEMHVRLHQRIVRQLGETEHEFINSFVPILAEEQGARVDALRARADRQWLAAAALMPTRGVGIDLYAIWLSIDHGAIDATTRQSIEQALVAHEVNLTDLHHQIESVRRQVLTRSRRDRVRALEGEIDGKSYVDGHRRRIERFAELGERVRQSTFAVAQAIRNALPQTVAEQWESEFKAAVFPEIYPDRAVLDELFDLVLDDEQVSEPIRDMLRGVYWEYRNSRGQLCADLEALAIEFNDRGARGENGFQRQFLPDALAPLLEERTELSRRWLVMLVEHVGIEALNRHAAAIPAALRPLLDELIEMESVSPQ